MYGILLKYMSAAKELGVYVMLLHYVKVQGLVFESSMCCSSVGNPVKCSSSHLDC